MGSQPLHKHTSIVLNERVPHPADTGASFPGTINLPPCQVETPSPQRTSSALLLKSIHVRIGEFRPRFQHAPLYALNRPTPPPPTSPTERPHLSIVVAASVAIGI